MPLATASQRSFPCPDAVALCALVCIALAASPCASADDAKPLIPQAALCPPGTNPAEAAAATPGSGAGAAVPPQALITWLLGENRVRDGVLDADGDGNTLVEEKIRALTEAGFCATARTACTAEDDTALKTAREQLQTFAAADGGPGYVIERLNPTAAATPRDLLQRRATIRCVALPAASDDHQPKGYWHHNGERESGLRLSGDIDNLSKSRGSLGAVKAAQLSITSDLIEDETAYRVNAVVGYAFELAGGDDLETSFIPFLEAERVTSGSETQIDTLGAGFQQAATVYWPGSLKSQFAVTPVYETDSDFESHTGTLKFRWTPALAETAPFPLGFSRAYGPLELRLGLDFLADAGRVFDDGDQDNLDGEGTFLRLGNQASMQLRGAPDTYIRPFELQIANRYLYNVDTGFETINQFDAALAYIFPGKENYQLSFAYSNGRDDNSLQLYEYWQTQFGIRF